MTEDRLTRKVSEKEYAQLQKYKSQETELYKEQIRVQREQQKKRLALQIRTFEREIAFKEKELSEGKIVEKHQDFEGGLKPAFFLESDIESLKLSIEETQTQMEGIKKVEAEEEKK